MAERCVNMLRKEKTLIKTPRFQSANGGIVSSNGHSRARKAKPMPYKNPALPLEKRLKDLMSRMTRDEKIAQMLCVWQKKAETLLDAEGNFDFQKAKAAFKHGNGIGQVGRPSDAGKGKD